MVTIVPPKMMTIMIKIDYKQLNFNYILLFLSITLNIIIKVDLHLFIYTSFCTMYINISIMLYSHLSVSDDHKSLGLSGLFGSFAGWETDAVA